MEEKIIGIYLIENKINSHKYVGQSVDINHRWSVHISRAFSQASKEYNKPLYRAFRKYGIENFNFSILEQCKKEELNSKETYGIKKLKTLTSENGYNIKSGGQQELSMIGEKHPNHKLTEEDVIQIRTAYDNHLRCKEVGEKYKDKVGWSGFSKVWKGETGKNIKMDVYTPENKQFHKHNTGQKGETNGRSIITEDDVREIRRRKQNGESRQSVFQDYKKLGLKQSGFDSIWYNITWKNIVIN